MKIFLIVCLFLLGCVSPPMTNKEIINAVKECEKAGLEAEAIKNSYTERIIYIQCIPIEPGCG